MLAAWLSYSSG